MSYLSCGEVCSWHHKGLERCEGKVEISFAQVEEGNSKGPIWGLPEVEEKWRTFGSKSSTAITE